MKATEILYYAVHPNELKSIVQWHVLLCQAIATYPLISSRKTWHDPPHQRDEAKESEELRKCYFFLHQTSRSFAFVIQELHPELLVPVVLFYLALRALDTIEDDMTIPLEEKDPLLRNFHTVTEKKGWSFNGSGPDEKDRELLVQYDVVIAEYLKIKQAYRDIINDIVAKMGAGMADFCSIAEQSSNGVTTIKDYDLYCHYVAGLVGQGLTRLFVESGLANPVLLERPRLQESMGLFLQKTNIIRDVREDWDDNRRFWPKEIWSRHVTNFEDLFKPENLDAALNCSSDMVLNSLNHADECLFYLAGLKEQSVFNFAVIPQSMAIATLDLVFRNPLIFKQNVKITKGASCRIMMESTQNLRKVCEVFRGYIRSIHQKNTTTDPNFLKISIACGKVEQFIESIFPSQKPEDMQIAQAMEDDKSELARLKKKQSEGKAFKSEEKKDLLIMLGIVMLFLLILSTIMVSQPTLILTHWSDHRRMIIRFANLLV